MRPAHAKQALMDAYLELLTKKPASEIRVTELAARAGVNRVTFYRLFETREDVLVAILDKFDRENSVLMKHTHDPYELSDTMVKDMLNHHKKHRGMLKTILESEHASFLEHRIYEGSREPIATMFEMSTLPQHQAQRFVSFYVAGITRVICDWIMSDCKESPDELVEFFALPMKLFS